MNVDLSINVLLLVLLFGGMLKALVTIGLLGQGLGFSGAVFSVLTAALATILSVLMLQPVLNIPEVSVFSIGKQVQLTPAGAQQLEIFLQKNTDPTVTAALKDLAINKVTSSEPDAGAGVAADAAVAASPSNVSNFEKLGLGFLLTELKEAFLIGGLILLPFLLIDFLLALIFSAVGIQILSVRQVALPLKLLLFVSVDGWLLLTSNFLNNYSF